MNAFVYGMKLQFKMDMRSRSLLITCYLVPLLFFALMGGIFTSLMPETKDTLIQSMTVMGVSMGALIGVPCALVEIYGTDIKKMYSANGAPLCFGVLTVLASSFLHLILMSLLIFFLAPLAFHAALPQNLPLYFLGLALFVIVQLGAACVLGLTVKSQAKLTMVSQLLFLPSIMLSGILFPASLLPGFLAALGKLFPATWGYALLLQGPRYAAALLPLCGLLLLALFYSIWRLKRIRAE